jgi:hypothetical protein
MPKAITYRKEKNGFFRVIGYNASTTDADLLMRRLKELEKK